MQPLDYRRERQSAFRKRAPILSICFGLLPVVELLAAAMVGPAILRHSIVFGVVASVVAVQFAVLPVTGIVCGVLALINSNRIGLAFTGVILNGVAFLFGTLSILLGVLY